MKSAQPKVYGIGNPLIDIIAQVTDEDLERLGTHKGAMHLIDEQRRSELLQHIESKPRKYSCGGSCPNTIITLSLLGIEATLAGKVGADDFGVIYSKRLKELKVYNELALSEQPTGSSIILITPDSERTMNTYLGANRYFNATDINPKSIAEADYFHFTGYMWDTQSQKAAVERAIEIAHAFNTRITFDIADPFAVGRNRDAFLSLISDHVDVVFANSEEARFLFNNYDALECCKSMGKLCETAVVKNGKLGSFISHQQKIYTIPVQGPVEAIDTTGAGDIYAAGFLYGLCHKLSIEENGFIASYLAGKIIQQRGAQFSKETAQEVRSFLERTFKI